MENLLSQAAAELTIRSEVESTLTALLGDIEHAHVLERSLHAHNELHLCREQTTALKVRYDDREAAWMEDRHTKERLGMLLLEEIVKLSAREVKGEKTKTETEAKLRQLEDEKIKDAEKFNLHLQQQKEVAVLAAADKDKEFTKHADIPAKTAQKNGQTIQPGDEIPTNQGEKQNISDTACATEKKMVEQSGESPTIKVLDESNQAFVPHNLDETTLMIIFAYLDPLDVMNFAQANKALLTKVNAMFGMGGGEESGVDQQRTSGLGGDATASSVEKSHQPPLQPPTLRAPEAENLEVSSSTAKSQVVSGPTHKRSGSGISISTAGSGSSVYPFSQVSSWFSGADASSTPSAPISTNATSAKIATAPPSETGSEVKLNAAMANSMALKLTPAELSVILQMRKNLQKCEADSNKWRLEKEDAVANLASVEVVKEFLVTRVRDSERLVQSQKEEIKRVQNKNLEDQEVIVFLDERVKELEKACNEMKSKEAMTKKEAMDIVNKNEKKSRVLADMLRFEREQMSANEREWKTAKKVLVKEVKNCRARIVALEAEGDGYRQQNTQLKSGLMGLTHSSGGMSPRGQHKYRGNGRR